MSRLREESGFTLMELLVACGLMIIVLSATLGALETFGNTSTTNQRVSDAQDAARNTLDRMAWELRNATAYTAGTGTGSAVLRADPWDMVIKTVDPRTAPSSGTNPNNVQRVRYCLDTTTNKLYRQTQNLNVAAGQPTPTLPAGADCPNSGWTTTNMVVRDVVNGGTRRVFTYNQQDSSDVNAPAPAQLSDVSAVRARLIIDVNPAKPPAETTLSTGVFLRNQNRRPVATCTATPTGPGHVFLNASASVDPEGGPLTYAWKDGSTALTQTAPNFDFATSGSHSFSVAVTDSSSLTATATCTPDPVSVQ